MHATQDRPLKSKTNNPVPLYQISFKDLEKKKKDLKKVYALSGIINKIIHTEYIFVLQGRSMGPF
jgi:hypothetical protein